MGRTPAVCLAAALACSHAPAAAQRASEWSLLQGADTSHPIVYDAARAQTVLFGDAGGTRGGGSYAATWLWDGVRWTRRESATTPPARRGHAMVYDSAAQRVVLFGGADGQAMFADTWEWDGVDWTQRMSAGAVPSPRRDHVMAYDAARQRVVLFGGNASWFSNTPLGDTWEWDGTRWIDRTPAASPAARFAASMAHDPVRGRTVLVGGVGVADGTWEWDGTSWTLAAAAVPGLLPGLFSDLCFDDSTGLVVAVDMVNADLWSWDGAAWTRRTAAGALNNLTRDAQLAFDAARRRLVLALPRLPYASSDVAEWDGAAWTILRQAPATTYAVGVHPPNQQVVLFSDLGETWSLTAGRWQRLQPTAAPPARTASAMAGSPATGTTLLFGGFDTSGGSRFADTWEWNGATWTARTPATAPPARSQHAMAFDRRRNRAVLFGGASANGVLGDTWEWDGSNWLQRIPTTAPPARYTHAMAYDAGRAVTVMFGDWPGVGDTWEWDGVDWTQRLPANRPAGTRGVAMCYHERRNRVVLFGGDIGLNDETWEWDGQDWSLVATATRPHRRVGAAMVYDAGRELAVLFGGGGLHHGARVSYADTWVYGDAAGYRSFGSGCAGSLGVPALTGLAPPVLGSAVTLQLSGLPGGAAVLAMGFSDVATSGGVPLPVDLTALGLTGCSLWIDPLGAAFLATAGTSRTWSLAVPHDLALLGVAFFQQALVLDPAANPAGLTVTNAGRGEVGL